MIQLALPNLLFSALLISFLAVTPWKIAGSQETNQRASNDQIESDKPNVLFIFLDDFGWRDCGFMGSDYYETPHLDQLAREGMIFTNAYSAAA
ncbi:MAG: sulfatase-like hydrolase/transferase, partial [Rubripirellula sp.]